MLTCVQTSIDRVGFSTVRRRTRSTARRPARPRPGTRCRARRRARRTGPRARRAGAGRRSSLRQPCSSAGRSRRVAAVDVPADQLLEIGDIGHDRAGDLVLRAALRQRGGEQVGRRSRGRAALRAGRASSGSWSSGTARASSRTARISSLRFRSAGRLKSRSASRPRRFVGCRLAMATSRSSRKTWRSGRFCRRASSSRHSASRRAISRPRRLS